VLKYYYSSVRVDFSTVIEGMEHVINRVRLTQKRSVVALPFLGHGHHPDVDYAIRKAVGAGIVVVTSAGEIP